ncbi:hypothetical protein J6590_068347 [Homalodisca vitripennis]|nr:hypothetical protein J6590_068347 [Homalodisca vitripennis]
MSPERKGGYLQSLPVKADRRTTHTWRVHKHGVHSKTTCERGQHTLGVSTNTEYTHRPRVNVDNTHLACPQTRSTLTDHV